MPNHSAKIKDIRKNHKRRIANRLQGKTTRNLIRKLKETTDKKEADKLLTEVISKIDKNAKNRIIHKKKASNLKSKLTKMVNNI